MLPPRTPLDNTLFDAAAARAAGRSWKVVAKELNLDAGELRKLALRHRRTYRRYLAQERREVVEDSFGEAVNYLRATLRSLDEKVVLKAGDTLTRLWGNMIRHKYRPKKKDYSMREPDDEVRKRMMQEYGFGFQDGALAACPMCNPKEHYEGTKRDELDGDGDGSGGSKVPRPDPPPYPSESFFNPDTVKRNVEMVKRMDAEWERLEQQSKPPIPVPEREGEEARSPIGIKLRSCST